MKHTEPRKKKFIHECNTCRFLGHYFGHDVYICEHESNNHIIGPSIIARFGDAAPDYQSGPVNIVLRELWSGGGILVCGRGPNGEDVGMSYEAYLTQKTPRHLLAMLVALSRDWAVARKFIAADVDDDIS